MIYVQEYSSVVIGFNMTNKRHTAYSIHPVSLN